MAHLYKLDALQKELILQAVGQLEDKLSYLNAGNEVENEYHKIYKGSLHGIGVDIPSELVGKIKEITMKENTNLSIIFSLAAQCFIEKYEKEKKITLKGVEANTPMHRRRKLSEFENASRMIKKLKSNLQIL